MTAEQIDDRADFESLVHSVAKQIRQALDSVRNRADELGLDADEAEQRTLALATEEA